MKKLTKVFLCLYAAQALAGVMTGVYFGVAYGDEATARLANFVGPWTQ